jgi:Ribbon-helix-helix domain
MSFYTGLERFDGSGSETLKSAVDGRKTSVSLENEFWLGLREVADHEHTSAAKLVERSTAIGIAAIYRRIFAYSSSTIFECEKK